MLLIVNYHYIRDEKYKKGIYPKSLKELENHIEYLNKKGYNFVSIENLNKYNKNCLLTFDDGLKEQMEAYKFLKQKGIPAMFFVSTYPIKEKKVLNVHKLHFIRTQLDDKYIFDFVNTFVENIVFPKNLEKLYRYDTLESKKLKYLFNFILNEDIKTKIINELFKKVADEEEFSKKLYMGEYDLKELYNSNCLGTHTHRHLPLATLSEKEIINEIENSLTFFKKLGIENINSISYPYGGPKAVNEKVVKIVKNYFEYGLTMFRGINYNLNESLLLKRIDVNDIKEFA